VAKKVAILLHTTHALYYKSSEAIR